MFYRCETEDCPKYLNQSTFKSELLVLKVKELEAKSKVDSVLQWKEHKTLLSQGMIIIVVF